MSSSSSRCQATRSSLDVALLAKTMLSSSFDVAQDDPESHRRVVVDYECTHVGLFDTVRCRFPLPHHQDAEFQTKDLAAIVEDECWLGGLMDEYEITKAGRLRRRMHQRKWVKKPGSLFGGYFKSLRSWWERVPDVQGDVRIYTSDGTPGKRGYRWVEFRVRFTNGRVEEVRTVRAAKRVVGS